MIKVPLNSNIAIPFNGMQPDMANNHIILLFERIDTLENAVRELQKLIEGKKD